MTADDEQKHSHGDHWGCFAENVSEFIKIYLPTTIAKGSLLKTESPVGEIMTSAPMGSPRYPAGLFWPAGDLRFLVLVMVDNEANRNNVWSAYPWSIGGVQYSLPIEELIPWNNGIEGQIKVLVDPGFEPGRQI